MSNRKHRTARRKMADILSREICDKCGKGPSNCGCPGCNNQFKSIAWKIYTEVVEPLLEKSSAKAESECRRERVQG